MSTYIARRLASTRPYITAKYVAGEDGVLRPQCPFDCPDRPPGGEACDVRRDHWRRRSTGPCHPLFVARCAVHDRAFTVYPPGHVPYGRRAIAPCDAQGNEPDPPKTWDGTVFEAASDAASEVLWPRRAPGGTDFWFSTQMKQLRLAERLTGTHPDLSDDIRHRIAETLRVPALTLRDYARPPEPDEEDEKKIPAPVWRGQAVLAVLRAVPGGLVRRLRIVGHLLGLWGRPLHFDGVALRPLTAFREGGRGPPTR